MRATFITLPSPYTTQGICDMNRFYVPLVFAVTSLPFLLITEIIPQDRWISVTLWPIPFPIYLWETSFILRFLFQICCIISIPMAWASRKWLLWIIGLAFAAFLGAHLVSTTGTGPFYSGLAEWSTLITPPFIIAAGAHLVHDWWKRKKKSPATRPIDQLLISHPRTRTTTCPRNRGCLGASNIYYGAVTYHTRDNL